MGAAAADAAGSRREKAAATRRQGGGALTWTQADDFEAPARLRVRAPELYGRRSAPRAIADLRLRPNNYRGPNPEMGAICNTHSSKLCEDRLLTEEESWRFDRHED